MNEDEICISVSNYRDTQNRCTCWSIDANYRGLDVSCTINDVSCIEFTKLAELIESTKEKLREKYATLVAK